MRLGQLARKLAIRPSEIVDFLATNNIFINDGFNTKLDDSHVNVVVNKFAPHIADEVSNVLPDKLVRTLSQPLEKEVPTTVLHTPTESIAPAFETAEANSVPHDEHIPVSSSDLPVIGQGVTSTQDKPEVIKAPKLELVGLKVVGKIELAEPKKNNVEIDASSKEKQSPEMGGSSMPAFKKRNEFKGDRSKGDRKESRPRVNPIALQREREAREAEEKKLEQIRLNKEKKTQHYLKKVKGAQPTKPVKRIEEPLEQLTEEELQENPKTWWGKFVKWLTS